MTIQQLSPELLSPNDYNPNRMNDEEFAELVAEVDHLGQLPKPVVVRPNGKGYVIVDGEHGWRAATKVGLKEISCEVIEVDDFEAMRQTYKRNQHGKHNPLLQGRMFKRMMDESKLSQREFALDMEVSEGTVRNSLEYVKAVDETLLTLSKSEYVRNGYAEQIEQLGVQQVRMLNRLPATVAALWLESGADVRVLFGSVGDPDADWEGDWQIRRYKELAPLFDIAFTRLDERKYPECTSPRVFKILKERVARMYGELDHYARGGLEQDELLPYFLRYWKRDFFVQDKDCFAAAVALITDTTNYPAKLVLTSEEWEAIFEEQWKVQSSIGDFQNRLKAKVFDKCGLVSNLCGYKIAEQLVQHEINNEAPEYVKDSQLSTQLRYDIWKTDGPEWKKEQLLASESVPGNWESELSTADQDLALSKAPDGEIAASIIGNLKPYFVNVCGGELLPEKQAAAINTLTQLPRDILLGLFDLAERGGVFQVYKHIIGGKK